MDELGYAEPPIIVTLRYPDKQKGLIIRTKEPTAKQWKKYIMPLLSRQNEPLAFAKIFIKLLDSWNLKYADQTSVPCTMKGLMGQNLRLVEVILKAWINNGIIIVQQDATSTNQDEQSADTEVDPFEGMDLPAIDMAAFESAEVNSE